MLTYSDALVPSNPRRTGTGSFGCNDDGDDKVDDIDDHFVESP